MVFALRKSDIPRVVPILVFGGFINSVGTSLLWPLNSLFMHNVLGRTLTEAGTIIALQSAFSLFGQFLSGFLADRYGARRLMILGLMAASLIVGLIGIYPTWLVYAPGIILLGLTQALIFVPLNALIHKIWPEGGRKGFNYLYVGNNAGVAIGTAIGGMVAQISFRLVFLTNSLTFLLYLLVVIFGVPKQETEHTVPMENLHSKTNIRHDPTFPVLLALSLGILFVWVAYIQWITILPVVMSQRHFSLPSYSILWTLNGVFIVTLQPLISWGIKVFAHSFKRQFYLACLLIASSFLVLIIQLPYLFYPLGMLLLTLGEMFILPTVPAAAAKLAPEGKVGAYQGIVGGAASGGRMFGPFLGGLVFDHGGGTSVWLLALCFMGAALSTFFFYGILQQKFDAKYRALNKLTT